MLFNKCEPSNRMQIEHSNKDNYKAIFWATWSKMYLQHTQMYLQMHLQVNLRWLSAILCAAWSRKTHRCTAHSCFVYVFIVLLLWILQECLVFIVLKIWILQECLVFIVLMIWTLQECLVFIVLVIWILQGMLSIHIPDDMNTAKNS